MFMTNNSMVYDNPADFLEWVKSKVLRLSLMDLSFQGDTASIYSSSKRITFTKGDTINWNPLTGFSVERAKNAE